MRSLINCYSSYLCSFLSGCHTRIGKCLIICRRTYTTHSCPLGFSSSRQDKTWTSITSNFPFTCVALILTNYRKKSIIQAAVWTTWLEFRKTWCWHVVANPWGPIERKVHGLFRWFILCGWGLSGFNPSAPLKLYDIDRICVMWYIPHNCSTRIRLTKFRCPDRFHVVWPPHCPGPLDRTSPLLPWWPDMHVFLGILSEPCLQSPSITRRLFGSHFFPNPLRIWSSFECRAKLGVGAIRFLSHVRRSMHERSRNF